MGVNKQSQGKIYDFIINPWQNTEISSLEDNQFLWDEEVHDRSFEWVKQLISESPVLKYFDPKEADTKLQCDASDKALGACVQSGHQ